MERAINATRAVDAPTTGTTREEKLEEAVADLQKQVEDLKKQLLQTQAREQAHIARAITVRNLYAAEVLEPAHANWEEQLADYLAQYKKDVVAGNPEGGFRQNTLKTYGVWLRPWVHYLESIGSPQNPTPMQLKEFLDMKHGSNPANYNRVGKQIVNFTNCYVNNALQLHKKLSKKQQPAKAHAKMDHAVYTQVKRYLETVLRGKCKGELPEKVKRSALETRKNLTAAGHLRHLAIYFAVVTGSRPSEAAQVVYHRRLHEADGSVRYEWEERLGRPTGYTATLGAQETKTRMQTYRWFLPEKRNWFAKLVLKADAKAHYNRVQHLQNAMTHEFTFVRNSAGIGRGPKHGHGDWNMRSARCWKATRWVQLCTVWDCMGWKVPPPNPLQHTTPRLTVGVYADKDAGNKDEAIKECLRRWPEEADKCLGKAGVHVRKKGKKPRE